MGKSIQADYTQQFLLPPSLEEWVPADHPARFIREFVEQLDVVALGFEAPASAEGRPRYGADLLLKIWLYGYVQRIRSTRKLEVACREHLSLLWLTGLIQPDHNSLWRFWRANQAALREVFKQTVQVAVRTGCVGLALQAVDGTKLAAASSSRTGWSQAHMAKLLAAVEESLQRTELAIAGEPAEAAEAGYRLPAGLAERQTLREQIKTGLAQLQADGRSHYQPHEPQARRMAVGQENRFAYNGQAVTDAKCGVMVAAELSRNEHDGTQLVPMIEQAQANLGVAATAAETLADTGYGAGADVQEAAAKHLPVLVLPAEGAPAAGKPYASRHFHYAPETRTVTCPQGRTLDHEGGKTGPHGRIERYRCHHQDCPVRALCTRDPKGRQFEVHPHTAAVQAMRARFAEPAVRARYRQRAAIAERSFAQIKQHDQFRRFTVWGWTAARTQWALVCAAVNLRILYSHWRHRLLPSFPPVPAFAASPALAALAA